MKITVCGAFKGINVGNNITLTDSKGNKYEVSDLGVNLSIRCNQYTGVRLVRDNNIGQEFYYDAIFLRNPNTQS